MAIGSRPLFATSSRKSRLRVNMTIFSKRCKASEEVAKSLHRLQSHQGLSTENVCSPDRFTSSV